MKRIIMLVGLITSLCFLSVGAENVTINGFTVELTDSTIISNQVTRYEGRIVGATETFEGELLLQESYFLHKNKPVTITAIADGAFYDEQSATNRLLGLTSIEINLPSLTILGNYTFRNCTTLTHIALHDGVTTINREAFRDCNQLTTITIPGSVTTIGNSAFYGCEALEQIIFSRNSNNDALTIGYDDITDSNNQQASMFKRNSNLMTASIARNFTYSGGAPSDSDNKFAPFSDCQSLENVHIFEGCTALAPYLFNQCVGLTQVNIANSTITQIGEKAFRKCTALYNITLPEGVATIGKSAFNGCFSLAEITIPGSVTNIENNVFHGCDTLSTVTFNKNADNTPLSIGYNDVTIDGSQASMFKRNRNLTTAHIARNFKYAQEATSTNNKYAPFSDCQSLREVYIYEGCTAINSYFFNDCDSLGKISFDGSTLTTIGSSALRNCTALVDITIPGSVTKINNSAFHGCSALESIHFEKNENDETLTLGIDRYLSGNDSLPIPMFRNNNSLRNVYLAREINCSEANVFYNSHHMPFYKSSITTVVLDEGCTTISEALFRYAENLSSVTSHPDTQIESIGQEAFIGTTKLTTLSLNMAQGSKIIASAFEGCTGLKSVVIEGGLEEIGNKAFSGCTSLDSIVLNEGLKIIGEYAFNDCTSLPEITIPGSVTLINNIAFGNCNALAAITFEPNENGTPITIGRGYKDDWTPMFQNNSALRTVNLARNISTESIWSGTIEYEYIPSFKSSPITAVNINEGCTTIVDNLFQDCTGLTSVTLCEGLEVIKKEAFRNCENITEITIPGSVDSIGNSVFHDCDALATVTFEKNENNAPLAIGYNYEKSGSMFKENSALRTVNLARDFNCVGGTLKDDDIKFTPFGDCEYIDTLNINEGCTVLGDYAFRDCEALTTVTIGEGLQRISKQAFRNCKKLNEITIPGSVTEIGNSVFYDCDSLKSVTFLPNPNNTAIAVGYNDISGYNGSLFKDCPALESAYIARNFTYSGGTPTSTNNKFAPFSDCQSQNFKSVHISDGCDTIGAYMFNNCKLTTVFIADCVRVIKERAFNNCTALKDVTLSEGVDSIGAYAFAGCTSLPIITLPESLNDIAVNTFSGCSNLGIVNALRKTAPEVLGDENTDGYFDPKNCKLHVDTTSVKSYRAHEYWSKFNITTPTGIGAMFEYEGIMYQITSLPEGENMGTVKVTQNTITTLAGVVRIPDVATNPVTDISYKVNHVDATAFAGCTALEGIIFPNSVVENENGIAQHVLGKEYIGNYYPDYIVVSSYNPANMGDSIFSFIRFTDANTILYVPAGMIEKYKEIITWKCFGSYPGKGGILETGRVGTQFTVKNLLYEITDSVTKTVNLVGVVDRTALKGSVTIPDSVVCPYNELPYKVIEVEDKAFINCYYVEKITIAGGITKIGNTVFRKCNQLNEVVFEQSPSNTSLQIGYNSEDKGSMFKHNSALRTVRLARNLTYTKSPSDDDFKYATFGDNAYITTLHIDSGCTEIGGYLFRDCVKLVNINIDSRCVFTSIGNDAFRNCELVAHSLHFNMAEGSTIGDRTFRDCEKVTSLTFSEGIETIGREAIRNCKKLTSFTFPASLNRIGRKAFYDCSGLIELRFEDSKETLSFEEDVETWIGGSPEDGYFETSPNIVKLYLGRNIQKETNVFRYGIFQNLKKLSDVTFGENVTAIYNCSFENCSAITQVELPSNLKDIKAWSFYNCSGLTGITIPGSVETIKISAFEKCSSLKWVRIEASTDTLYLDAATDLISNEGVYCSHFYYYEQLEEIYFDRNIYSSFDMLVVPAFAEMTSLKKAEIGKNCTEIQAGLFKGCTNMVNLTIHPECQFTTIGDEAFYNCKNLTDSLHFNIVEGASIGARAFRDCVKVPSFTFNEGVKKIGGEAFRNCEALTNVTIPGSVTEIGNDVFYDCDALKEITFAANTTEANPAIAIGLKTIDTDNSMFNGNGNLRTINVARNFTYNNSGMKYAPFSKCSQIDTVNILAGCTEVGKYQFRDCTGLKTLHIAPDCKLDTIREDAFRNCENVKTVNLPVTLKNIERQAFRDCAALDTVTCAAATPPTINEENVFDSDTYSSAMLLVSNEETQASYKAANYWANFTDVRTPQILCDKNYILNFESTGSDWPFLYDEYTTQAIFTNIVTGDTVYVQGEITFQQTSAVYHLAKGNADATLGEGDHRFTHVEFVLTNESDGSLKNTTGSVYYNGEICHGYIVYHLASRRWLTSDDNVPTHLDDIEADSECTMRIYAAGGNVVVHGAAAGETIAIYDLAGTLCHTSRVDSDVQRIALPARGIYIVRVGARVAKVVI